MDAALPISRRLPRPRRGTGGLAAAGAVAGAAALTATAVVLGASAHEGNPATTAMLRGAMVAAPLGVGLYATHVAPYQRFGRLLLAVGLVSFATTLAESPEPALYSLGRTAGWILEALLVVVLLAFPTGRLATRVDRRLAAAIVAVVGTFFLPTLLLSEHFRLPSPYTSCSSGCPANALPFAEAHDAAAHTMLAAGGILAFVVMLSVAARLQHRIAAARPVERQVLVPVLAVGIVRTAMVGSAIVGRDLGGTRQVAEVSAALIAWLTPLVALAFLAGVVRSRLFGERALRRLALCVRARPDVPALQRAFADALEDPGAEIVFPRGGAPVAGWMDARGAPVDPPASGADRALHVVRGRDGRPVAALACDRALADRPQLLDPAADLAAVALENLRLTADADAAVRDASASRARLAAAADRERRRIERDLHDGAQQRLVALRIELSLVEDLVRRDPERCVKRLRELEDDVEEALDELRALAHGVCPPLLADRGLPDALRAAASRSPVPVSLRITPMGRQAPEVESAVYFCVLEALQNVAKHAPGATRAVVLLDGDVRGELRFSVRDDGPGVAAGASPSAGTGAGLANMRDRLAALGGEVEIVSRPGCGTEVRGRVPVAPRASRSLAAHAG
ncbi:MAG TPA: histidine kinase [Baekduia sp.]|nr:histidine kinase [Baekduia sp.]